MAVSKRLRYEVLRRDNHTCRYCGATAPDAPLRVDHVTPAALGGADTPDNLVTACEPCNSGKSSATTDAAVVADVSQDALRWAEAMKQAAEELRAQEQPKHEYRAAFQQAWAGWTWMHNGAKKPFDLPDGWKASLDNFREAGLPQEVWPDIVEKAMSNKSVRNDDVFRYCCGIAWRMVSELQERAKTITGASAPSASNIDSVVRAAVDVWLEEQPSQAVDDEQKAQLQASAIAARATEDPHRILHGAQYAAWCGGADVGEALAQLDDERVLQKWTLAWLAKAGEWPSDERTAMARDQIGALLIAGVDAGRVAQAAIYAGSHHSARMYFGLSEEELAISGQHELIARAAETWAGAYHATTNEWPTETERASFFASLRRIGDDGDTWIADIYPAAAAAGTYQDPDMATCLTRHLSVFEAAAKPLQPAA